MSEKPILLFDWDGVIVDSNAWKWGGAWAEVFAEEPELLRLMEQVLIEDKKKSLGRKELVARVYESATASGYQPQRTPEEYVERFGEAVRSGVVRIGMFPGAREVLTNLHAAGYRIFVISMTTQNDLEYTANELGVADYFVGLRGMPGSKEDHAREIQAAESPSARYVVIGDGAGDRALAEHLGCPFVGVTNEWNRWADDETLMYKINTITELPEILVYI